MLKQLVKTGAFGALRLTGGFLMVRDSKWRSSRLLILCYHGISLDDEHEWRPEFYMSQNQFERRLAILKRNECSVLPLDPALQQLKEGTLPPRSVALTFDDGMYDFYTRAFPVLDKYRYPATVYLTTYYCDYNRPVFPLIVSYMLWKARNSSIGPDPELGLQESVSLSTGPQRDQAAKAIEALAEAQHLSGEQKDALAQKLASRLGIDYAAIVRSRLLHVMTPAEVTDLSRRGVDIQLHTHRHRTPRHEGQFAREIVDNRRRIEEIAGSQATHFCYPSGVYEYEFLPWLEQQKVVSATTCNPGIATSESNLLLLPRFVDTTAQSELVFEAWVTGAAPLLFPSRTAHQPTATISTTAPSSL